MEMIVDFPGGAKVDAHFGGFTVKTDQPVQGGGENTAPSPFLTFLASLGTCAGIYVLGFCRSRGLPTDGIRIIQRMHTNSLNGALEKVELEIQVPPTFPDKYDPALIRSAEQCAVKKAIEQPPAFDVHTTVV
jgi:ribosomal protein S12 methylthiotransferase accessory factor